ncbi:sodium:proton antiporter, partial [Phocaeicola vulgatus]|nr:sodium:proton antiporter [Phocaeicola vulgatus]
LGATAVCVLIGRAGFRRPGKDFELAVTNNIAGGSTALIILLIIGAWSVGLMGSGVVPTLIYNGIQGIDPHIF